MDIVEVVHTDLYASTWPRYDTMISRKDIEDPDLLTAVTSAQAKILKAPSGIYTVQMKPDRDPEFSDWQLGDWCELALRSGIAPLGVVQMARILQWDYTPPSSDGTEEVKLTFEGDDLA
jgi:hypothetical protein